jgi:KaiC/GvpD/RAD55 family RecA-like ATPase
MDPFFITRSVEGILAKAYGELEIELDALEGIIPKDFKPDLIVLDSLSAVASAFVGKDEGYRIYVEQLFKMFKSLNAISFMITEIEHNIEELRKNTAEEFLADGVILFYNVRMKSERVNAIEILKIRGIDHKKKIVPFKIVAGRGINVYPHDEVFT